MPAEETFDVVVVGSGAAGLAAAAHRGLRRGAGPCDGMRGGPPKGERAVREMTAHRRGA